MVVRRGHNWGSVGSPDPSLPVACDDTHASQLIERGCKEFILASGDMARTVGASPPSPSSSYRRLPIDLVTIGMIDSRGHTSTLLSMSHCLIRQPCASGGILRGSITVICNAQFLRGRDIAPRGHPNDAKIEVVEFSHDLSLRQRLLVLQKMRTGDHLPHPAIHVRQISGQTKIGVKGTVVIDGRRLGTRTVEYIEPITDGVVIWAAAPIEALESQD